MPITQLHMSQNLQPIDNIQYDIVNDIGSDIDIVNDILNEHIEKNDDDDVYDMDNIMDIVNDLINYDINDNEKQGRLNLIRFFTDNVRKLRTLMKIDVGNKENRHFEEFVKIVNKNGGTCLGTINDYKNAITPIKVKCKDGHEWKISPSNVKLGRWCPICKTNTGELIAYGACKFLFGKDFKKVRPDWLKNKNNNNLELDIYNEELKLAIEYNGVQHYHYIPFFHRTEEKFYERMDDDKIKIEKCKERGINLIVISYTTNNDDICSYIYNEAKKLNIPMIDDPENFDYSDLRSSSALTEKVKRIMDIKKGKILEGSCFGRDSKLLVKCEKGHTWTSTVKYICLDRWCIMCANEMTDEKKVNISEGMRNYLQTEEGKENKKKSMEKRSETLANQKAVLRKTITEKLCGNCKGLKPVTQFDKKKAAKDGFQTNCKVCVAKIKKEFRAKNKLRCEKFPCDVCGATYDLKDSLTRHKKTCGTTVI